MLKRSIKNITKIFLLASTMIAFNANATDILKSEYKVKKGDSIIKILQNNYINKTDISDLIYKTKNSKKLQNLHVGKKITIYKDKNGKLKKMIVEINDIDVLVVSKSLKNDFTIKKGLYKTDEVDQYVLGNVSYSFNKTLKEMKLTKAQKEDLKDMFKTQLDLNKIKKGSQIVAVYKDYYKGKSKVKSGDLIAAEITYKGKDYTAYSYHDYKGVKTYFDQKGQPLVESITRTPLKKYTRVSSQFKLARKHPVLGYTRPHKGVDLASPRGTPVYAAASGKIAMKAYQKRGYGNVIVINHSDGYSTLYGHMNKFNKGMYSGKRIKKGQIIGFVGSTGLSTGNHLHFEIRKKGIHLDPLHAKLPSGNKIASADISKFKSFKRIHDNGFRLVKAMNKKENKTRVAIRNK